MECKMQNAKWAASRCGLLQIMTVRPYMGKLSKSLL